MFPMRASDSGSAKNAPSQDNVRRKESCAQRLTQRRLVATVTSMLIDGLIDIYSLFIVAAVVVSWTEAPRDHPAVKLLRNATEPVLKPVRGVLPTAGGIDFSPLAVLVGLQLLGSLF